MVGAPVACALLVTVGCSSREPSADQAFEDRADSAAEVVESTTSTTAVTTTTTTTVAPPSDLDASTGLAVDSVITEADLPAGWVECCPPTFLRPSALAQHICGAPEGLPPHVAGYVRVFALGLAPDGSRRGEVQATSAVAASAADAEREFEAVDSADYLPCTTAAVERDAARAHHVRVVGRSSERRPMPGGEPGVLDSFTTTFQTIDGTQEVVHTEFARMQIGRVIVRLQIRGTGEPIAGADVGSIVAAVAARVDQQVAIYG
jgi:hypothetical protein